MLKIKKGDYKLKVYEDHYELDCQKDDDSLFLVFDKPVYVTGRYCKKIIAPKIVVKRNVNNALVLCIANKAIVNNSSFYPYEINYSKIKDIYFYNKKVSF